MNIPFDELYNFVQDQLDNPASLYLFSPPGSRKINDLGLLNNMPQAELLTSPVVICHDQEPLNFHYYSDYSDEMQYYRYQLNQHTHQKFGLEKFDYFSNLNLATAAVFHSGVSIYDQTVLLHSEENSADLDLYQRHAFVPCHWWCHAMIARDWYRYAEIDAKLQQYQDHTKRFLIYARAWSGTREYRLKFLEKVLLAQLDTHSVISFDATGLDNFEFENPDFEVDIKMFKHLPQRRTSSDASASYNAEDQTHTDLAVVLETVFDGQRIHLTEKTLRPIACKQPFMIAAGPGALEYIKRYGFKTFAPWINESYDQETNSLRRLELIVEEMQRIKCLQGDQYSQWREAVTAIAEYNQRWFFTNMSRRVVGELQRNLNQAVQQVYITQGKRYLEHRRRLRRYQDQDSRQYLTTKNNRIKMSALRRIRQVSGSNLLDDLDQLTV